VTSISLAFLLSFSATSHLPTSLQAWASFLGSLSTWQCWQFWTAIPAALAFFWKSMVAEAVPPPIHHPKAASPATASPSLGIVFMGLPSS
jgi:hypothetical protein